MCVRARAVTTQLQPGRTGPSRRGGHNFYGNAALEGLGQGHQLLGDPRGDAQRLPISLCTA